MKYGHLIRESQSTINIFIIMTNINFSIYSSSAYEDPDGLLPLSMK